MPFYQTLLSWCSWGIMHPWVTFSDLKLGKKIYAEPEACISLLKPVLFTSVTKIPTILNAVGGFDCMVMLSATSYLVLPSYTKEMKNQGSFPQLYPMDRSQVQLKYLLVPHAPNLYITLTNRDQAGPGATRHWNILRDEGMGALSWQSASLYL